MPILPSGASIDPNWLSEQLNLRVDELEIESLGVPQGFTSNTMRLRLRGPSDALPSSLILKIDSDDPQSREIALLLNCFRREVVFIDPLRHSCLHWCLKPLQLEMAPAMRVVGCCWKTCR